MIYIIVVLCWIYRSRQAIACKQGVSMRFPEREVSLTNLAS